MEEKGEKRNVKGRWRALGRGGNKGQRYVFIDAKKSMQNIKVILQKLFMKKRISTVLM